MAHIMSPPPSSPANSPTLTRTLSTGSIRSLYLLASASSSVASLVTPKPPQDMPERTTIEGLRHVKIKLDARHYKLPSFVVQLLDCVRSLSIPTWSNADITPRDVNVFKVSGSLTNAVFFVSARGACTLLLRVYGPSSGSLISRPRELHTLHLLSSKYHIGPQVYGTFTNGRIEEYFESTTLTAADIRVPKISRWIAARMAELHSVDVELIEGTPVPKSGWEIAAQKNVAMWLPPAEQVLALSSFPEQWRAAFDLERFKQEWSRYWQWLTKVADVHNGSQTVFAHNDTQYGNLLRLNHLQEGADEHSQIVVVDFEYASPNPAAYDIANHFHEWTANYHDDVPHLLDSSRYPTSQERRNFYASYLQHAASTHNKPIVSKDGLEARAKKLDEQVRFWSPASHATWAIWGIVQARDDIEAGVKEPEFDYIAYAQCRMAAFRREVNALI
ncbi:hypothetical protein AX16_005609 [Volvariella volvacea WC 439]|nr:hypothetical protein AX16_005609 [Volvariella volvacea WC 439]